MTVIEDRVNLLADRLEKLEAENASLKLAAEGKKAAAESSSSSG